MHHSSIRDHLSKCHPEKSHNSCEPGYVFNSAAVPEPELSQAYEKNSMKNFDLIDSIHSDNPNMFYHALPNETMNFNYLLRFVSNQLNVFLNFFCLLLS